MPAVAFCLTLVALSPASNGVCCGCSFCSAYLVLCCIVLCMRMVLRLCLCLRACMHACVRACVRVCVLCVCVFGYL